MTKFAKENFSNECGYVHYFMSAPHSYQDRKFVARFKYGRGAGSFITFLIKHFTVEEYFSALEQPNASPLQVAQSRGYLLPHIKTWLKRDGYPVTVAGFDQFIQDGITKRNVK